MTSAGNALTATAVWPASAPLAMARSPHGQRRDVQGLRALAVLVVIADHLWGWPAGGFVGVDVFFVISGYLITGLLLREHARTGTISFRGFSVRRALRILPNSLLVLAVTTAVATAVMAGDRRSQVLHDVLWAAGFSANWRFVQAGTDYFQRDLPPSPVQHFWSLAVEEQFYFVWPWVLLALLGLGRGRVGWVRRHRTAAVSVLLPVVVVASFAVAVRETAVTPTTAYFSTISRAWELGVGALVAVWGAHVARRVLDTAPALRTALAWAGLLGIVVAVFVVPAHGGFPAPWALLPVLCAAAVLLAGHGAQVRIAPLTNPVAQYVGDTSYSLYLWHWPVIVLLVRFMDAQRWTFDVAVLLITAVTSLGAYYAVEKPVRRVGVRRVVDITDGRGGPPRRRPLVRALTPFAVAVTAAALVTAGGLVMPATQPTTNDVVAAAAARSGLPGDEAAACLGAGSAAGSPCPVGLFGDSAVPGGDVAESDTQDAFACWMTAGAPLRTCTYGSARPDAARLALVGDSHAASLLPALTAQLQARNWRLDTYVGWGCRWGDLPEDAPCKPAMRAIDRALSGASGDGYDTVLVTGTRKSALAPDAMSLEDMATVWAPVVAAGTRVVVIADNPLPARADLDCLTRVRPQGAAPDCSSARGDALALVDPAVEAAALVPGVDVVDLSDVYCVGARCPLVIGGVVVYRDTAGHLTATFSRSLGAVLAERVEEVRRTAA